jgi:hypothetical protein
MSRNIAASTAPAAPPRASTSTDHAIRRADSRSGHAPSEVGKLASPADDPVGAIEALAVAVFEIPVKIKFPGEKVANLDAKICRVNSGFLVISCSIRFDRGQTLGVLYQERGVDTEVLYCKKQTDGSFRVGLTILDGKHGSFRTEQRLPVSMDVTILIAGHNAPISATVIDISPSGLGLTSKKKIAPGEMACVDLGGGLAFGQVRHCEKGLTDYRLGLHIEECLLGDPAGLHPSSRFLKIARGVFGKT